MHAIFIGGKNSILQPSDGNKPMQKSTGKADI